MGQGGEGNRMAIVGLGVDLVEVSRMARAMRRGRFVERVFTVEEQRVLRFSHPEERLAARFAAKEACLKALGVELNLRRLKEIEVVRAKTGAPALVLSGEMAERLRRLGGQKLWLSLAHERGAAVAVVVVET